MNRRTFNKSLGLGALSSLVPSAHGQQNDGSHAPTPKDSAVTARPYVTAQIPVRTVDWPSRQNSRNDFKSAKLAACRSCKQHRSRRQLIQNEQTLEQVTSISGT
jgi:hypothetical protein